MNTTKVRFNGAEAKKPRKCNRLCGRVARLHASMGPRQKSLGNAGPAQDNPQYGNNASMGPRQKSLGNWVAMSML